MRLRIPDVGASSPHPEYFVGAQRPITRPRLLYCRESVLYGSCAEELRVIKGRVLIESSLLPFRKAHRTTINPEGSVEQEIMIARKLLGISRNYVETTSAARSNSVGNDIGQNKHPPNDSFVSDPDTVRWDFVERIVINLCSYSWRHTEPASNPTLIGRHFEYSIAAEYNCTNLSAPTSRRCSYCSP